MLVYSAGWPLKRGRSFLDAKVKLTFHKHRHHLPVITTIRQATPINEPCHSDKKRDCSDIEQLRRNKTRTSLVQ